MVVGNGAQRAADRGALEKQSERRDERPRDRRGDQVELVDEHPADDQWRLWDTDVERMHIAAPEELAEAVEKESKADRPHEKDDLLLIDERTKHQPFDGDGEQHHDRSCNDKGAPDW